MFKANLQRGFSGAEILVTLSILAFLFLVGTLSFNRNVAEKELQSIADNIAAKMELAKSNAVTGKNGLNYGIKFNSSSYVYFTGSTYISTNQSNETTQISNKFQITNDIPGADDAIIFSKIKGNINHSSAVTITISEISNASSSIQLTIGKLGDVTMIK